MSDMFCIFKAIASVFAFLINAIKGIINFFIGLFNKNRVKKANEINRGVTYERCNISQAFTHNGHFSYIISGGARTQRSEIIAGILADPHNQGVATVILHQGDRSIEQATKNVFGNRAVIINQSNQFYDPCSGRREDEIAKLLFNAAPKSYDIKANGKTYLEAAMQYRKALGKGLQFAALARCPFDELFNRVDSQINNGKISMSDGDAIKRRLMAGQTETYKIESYITDLNDQIETFTASMNSSKGISILESIRKKSIISIDILNASNYLAIDLLLKEVEESMRKGLPILLVISNVDIQENGSLCNMIKSKTSNCNIIISADDLFALANSEEKVFHTVLGNCERMAILQHTSGMSAQKWSEAIGYYDKIDVSTSYGKTRSQQVAHFFPIYTNSSTTNYSNKRENIVKPEEITRLSHDEAFIYEGDRTSITHVQFIK